MNTEPRLIDLAKETPVDARAPKLELKDKISVLMQEYATLRAEILVRIRIGFQLIAVAIAVVGLLLNANTVGPSKTILAFACGAVLLTAIYCIFDGTTRIAARLRELEQEVNGRAGEELLKWETKYALMRFGELRRKPYRPNR